MKSRLSAAARGIGPAVLVFAAAMGGVGGAQAAFPNQLPFMCFNTAHTFHQIFGPDSFFLKENQQGLTGFQEGGPTPRPTVAFPLRQ